jgi:hypothetical protein
LNIIEPLFIASLHQKCRHCVPLDTAKYPWRLESLIIGAEILHWNQELVNIICTALTSLTALRLYCLILYHVFGVTTQFTGRKNHKPHLRHNHKNYNRHAIRFWSKSATLAILFWNWWRTCWVVQNTHLCLIIIINISPWQTSDYMQTSTYRGRLLTALCGVVLRTAVNWKHCDFFKLVNVTWSDTNTWGDPKIPGIVKTLFKVFVQVWNFSPLRSTPPATGCSNLSTAPNAGNIF